MWVFSSLQRAVKIRSYLFQGSELDNKNKTQSESHFSFQRTKQRRKQGEALKWSVYCSPTELLNLDSRIRKRRRFSCEFFKNWKKITIEKGGGAGGEKIKQEKKKKKKRGSPKFPDVDQDDWTCFLIE